MFLRWSGGITEWWSGGKDVVAGGQHVGNWRHWAAVSVGKAVQRFNWPKAQWPPPPLEEEMKKREQKETQGMFPPLSLPLLSLPSSLSLSLFLSLPLFSTNKRYSIIPG